MFLLMPGVISGTAVVFVKPIQPSLVLPLATFLPTSFSLLFGQLWFRHLFTLAICSSTGILLPPTSVVFSPQLLRIRIPVRLSPLNLPFPYVRLFPAPQRIRQADVVDFDAQPVALRQNRVADAGRSEHRCDVVE